MKRIVSLVLVIFLFALPLAGCGKAPAGADETSSDEISELPESPVEFFEYKENEEGGITVTKYIGDNINVVVPKKINGKDVTRIGESAFEDNGFLYSVVLPDSVTVIDESAFENCWNLVRFHLPDGLLEIGPAAFNQCSQLAEISLPDSLLTLGSCAFQLCQSLKKITIPASIIDWGSDAFFNSGIEEVTFAKGIQTIGAGAFASTQIRQIRLPGTLTVIPSYAVAGCKNLESVMLEEGIETVEKEAFGSYEFYETNTKITELVIPASVKTITEQTFTGCEMLKKVKFEGDAPANFSAPEVPITQEEQTSLYTTQWDFTVCYHEGAKGFTSPTWEGYTTEIW